MILKEFADRNLVPEEQVKVLQGLGKATVAYEGELQSIPPYLHGREIATWWLVTAITPEQRQLNGVHATATIFIYLREQ